MNINSSNNRVIRVIMVVRVNILKDLWYSIWDALIKGFRLYEFLKKSLFEHSDTCNFSDIEFDLYTQTDRYRKIFDIKVLEPRTKLSNSRIF